LKDIIPAMLSSGTVKAIPCPGFAKSSFFETCSIIFLLFSAFTKLKTISLSVAPRPRTSRMLEGAVPCPWQITF
jgi:hypothetical protein